jgi:hypothetical protein
MGYDKPKVTIDLDEYNNLVARNKELEEKDTDAEKVLYKKAIWALLVSTSGINPEANRELVKMGVGINVAPDIGVKFGEDYKRMNVYAQ